VESQKICMVHAYNAGWHLLLRDFWWINNSTSECGHLSPNLTNSKWHSSDKCPLYHVVWFKNKCVLLGPHLVSVMWITFLSATNQSTLTTLKDTRSGVLTNSPIVQIPVALNSPPTEQYAFLPSGPNAYSEWHPYSCGRRNEIPSSRFRSIFLHKFSCIRHIRCL